jgi:hypothetical protein
MTCYTGQQLTMARPKTIRQRNDLVASQLPPRATRSRTSRDWQGEEKEHKLHRKALRRKIRDKIPADKRLCGKELRTGGPCQQAKYVVERRYEDKPTRYFLAPTCFAHLPDDLRAKLELKNLQPKTPGRPPRPRVIDVMKEQIEQEIAEYMAPYRESLLAMKQVVVGNGAHARMVEVPDHRTRLQATEALLDRVYGKPKQTTDQNVQISTPDVEVPSDQERQQAVARILAESGAIHTMAARNNPASQN